VARCPDYGCDPGALQIELRQLFDAVTIAKLRKNLRRRIDAVCGDEFVNTLYEISFKLVRTSQVVFQIGGQDHPAINDTLNAAQKGHPTAHKLMEIDGVTAIFARDLRLAGKPGLR